jgi:hypothetical protein
MTKRILFALLLALSTLSVVSAVSPGATQNLTASVNGNTVTLTWQSL